MQTGVSQPYLQRQTLRVGQSCTQTGRRPTGVGTTARRTNLRQQRSCMPKQASAVYLVRCEFSRGSLTERTSRGQRTGRRCPSLRDAPRPPLSGDRFDTADVAEAVHLSSRPRCRSSSTYSCVYPAAALRQGREGRHFGMCAACARRAWGCRPGRTVVAGVLAVQVAGRVREGAQEAATVGAIPLSGGPGHLAVALRTRRRQRSGACTSWTRAHLCRWVGSTRRSLSNRRTGGCGGVGSRRHLAGGRHAEGRNLRGQQSGGHFE